MGLSVKGTSQVAAELRQRAAASRAPKGMKSMGPTLLELFQQNIRQHRLGAFKPLAAATVRERQRLGFGAGPPLVRTGSLLESIQVLTTSATFVEVGVADDGRAAALDRVRQFLGFTDGDAKRLTDPLFESVFA